MASCSKTINSAVLLLLTINSLFSLKCKLHKSYTEYTIFALTLTAHTPGDNNNILHSNTHQVRSQKLNKEEAIPSPYPRSAPFSLPLFLPSFSLSLRSRIPPPIAARRSGECSSSPSRSVQNPAAKRIWTLENASMTTSLVLLCDRITCSITGHITSSCLNVATALLTPQLKCLIIQNFMKST